MFSAAPVHAVPTIVGPGVGIVEPVTSTTYFSEDGSSMAAPHVAAAIALVLSALRAKRPNAKPREAAFARPVTPRPVQHGGGVEPDVSASR